jgi:DeoR/GlpR family transcriptional regulator of sugar metabolism
VNDRQRTILSKLSEKEKITVNELIEILNVSGVTVRQDLDYLQKQGFIQRIHGGAVLQSEDEISHRLGINYEVKTAIAESAAKTIKRGETIFIEAGSANALLARMLSGLMGLTVVTNNVFITRTLKNSSINVILLGGIFQHQSECVVGALAQKGLEFINFSKAFLGVDGISPKDGVTCADMLRADVSSEVVRKSQEVIVLTDSAKIGKTAMSKVCDLKDIDCIVTDSGITDDMKAKFEECGVEVIIATQ